MVTMAVFLSGCRVLEKPLTNYRLHAGNLYQSTNLSEANLERRYTSLSCIVTDLPPRLVQAGASAAVIQALTQPNWLGAARMRLTLGRGKRWETARVEHLAFRQAYSHASFGYYLFHAAVLVVASLLPPRAFYRLRNWYSQRGLARKRRVLGTPVPNSSLYIRTAWR
jgi:hypothetical protein